MPVLHKNISAAADIHNPKWFPSANNGDYSWKNEKGELESTDELVLPAALDFVDASVAPPTTNTGDIYVLSSGGSVNAGWGSVALKDWVRYDGTDWNEIIPQKSTLCYDKNTDSLYAYDGTDWNESGGGGDSIYTGSGTIPSAVIPTMTNYISFQGDSTSDTGATPTVFEILNDASGAAAREVLRISANYSAVGSGGFIEFKVAGSTARVGRIQSYLFGTNNAGLRFYSYDGSNDVGDSFLAQDNNCAFIGKNVLAQIGSEEVSIQGSIAIADTGDTLGLFGQTPIAQPTTAHAAATFVANTSGIADDTATWDGYTIGQVVKALRDRGDLA